MGGGRGRREKGMRARDFSETPTHTPNQQRWCARKWRLSRNTHTLHTRFFVARLTPDCMLTRCLGTKISASELRRKLIEGALLVGTVPPPHPPHTHIVQHPNKKECTKKKPREMWQTHGQQGLLHCLMSCVINGRQDDYKKRQVKKIFICMYTVFTCR